MLGMKGRGNDTLLLCRLHSDIALDAVLLAVLIPEAPNYVILVADRDWNDRFHSVV